MATLNREELKQLRSFRANGYPVTSVYWTVKRGSNDATLLELKNTLALDDDKLKRWVNAETVIGDDVARIQRHLKEQQTQGSSSVALAIFASSPADLWQVHELNAPVTDRVVVSEAPFVRPLVRLFGEQAPYAVVLMDHTCARFFLFREGNVEPRGDLTTDVPREDEIHRLSEDQFQHHQQEWVHRHMKQTSERLLTLLQAENYKGLWLGAKEEVARALESSVHSYVKDKWCGAFPVDVHADAAEIRERITPLIADYERQQRADLLQRLETAAKSGGTGAIGMDDTLAELQSGKVMTLLVEREFVAKGGRCTNCESLTVDANAPCPYCSSEVRPVANLVDEMVEAAFLSGAEIMFVPEGEGLERLGRIGALLRFG
ncbi:MAG: hypothetical protein LC737_03255 [Chloroflexi bacterium]|nr:hypothetical protein [Chloroflexota bacterium]